jgi:chaperone modulatory protein CbpM
MFETKDFLRQLRIEAMVLEAWIEAGWLVPARRNHERHFTEADLARARLIGDLQRDLGVNDEGVGVILDLVDQMHGLRRTMRELVTSLRTRPEAVQRDIVADIRARMGSRR